ncbi:MAG: tetratricopeptide repeat protein [Planctomycetota bacterium]|nr:tetratricopeptide repeat protein [Planctomycetota bacterium]MDA1211716.1 tetratricopeptide repeat protein [Planctomycetota bacterium]
MVENKKRVYRLNVPFLKKMIYLGVGSIFLIGGVHVLHSRQVHRNAELLFRLADDAEQAGKENLALTYLGQYTRLRKDDLEGLKRYARLISKDTESFRSQQAAFMASEQILRMDPTDDEFRRKAADIAIKMQRFQDAIIHIEELIKLHKGDAEVEHMQGRCYNGMGDYRKSSEALLRAIEQDNTKIDYYMGLINLVLTRSTSLKLTEIDPIHEEDVSNTTVAERLVSQMVENGLPKYEAYLARAKYQIRSQKLAEAQDDIDQALKLAGHEPDVLIAGIELAILRADEERSMAKKEESDAILEQARELARTGLGLSEQNMRFYVLLAEIERGEGRIDESLKIVMQGIAELQNQQALSGVDRLNKLGEAERQLLFAQADLIISQAKADDGTIDESKLSVAQEIIGQLRETLIMEALIDFLEGRILVERELWNDASLLLERTRGKLTRFPSVMQRIDLMLSQCYIQLDNPDANLNVFKRAQNSYPLWVPARLGYASALARVNRIDESIGAYVGLMGYPGVSETVAQLLIARQASLPSSRRDWSAVGKFLDAIETRADSDKESAEIAVIKSQYRYYQDEFDDALKTLEEAQKQYPDELVIWTNLIEFQAHRTDLEPNERTERAKTLLKEALDKFGDTYELRLVQIGLIARSTGEDVIEKLKTMEEGLDAYSDDERLQVLDALISAYQRYGTRDRIAPLIQSMIDIRPKDIEYRLKMIEFAGRQGDDNAVAEHIRVIREVEGPGGPCGNYVEASQLIYQATRERKLGDNIKRARELLMETAKKRPAWYDIPRTQGILEELVGNFDEAFDYYNRAIALGDRSHESILRMIQYLYEKQRYGEADRELRRLIEEDPSLMTGQLARLGWRIAWEREQFEQALGMAVNVAEDSEDYRDQLWVSQLRQVRGLDSAEVEAPLRKAISMAPDAPDVWLSLIGFLVREQRIEEAEVAIGQAESALPKEVLREALGRCFELVGDTDKAEEQYRKDVDDEPTNVARLIRLSDFYIRYGRLKDAELFLNRIVDPKTKAQDFAVAWARRRQALQIASSRRFDDTARALELLESNIRDRKYETVADLRAEAAIRANGITHHDHLAAIETYEQIAAYSPLSQAEMFRLAHLYKLTANWPKCRDLLQLLIADKSDDMILLSFYISSLIELDDSLEAEVWLRQMEQKFPNGIMTKKLRARLLAANGRPKEAADLLLKYFADSSADSSEETLTGLIEQGNAKGAIEILQKFVSDTNPALSQEVLDEGEKLLNEGQTDDALERLRGFLQMADVSSDLRIAGLRSTADLLVSMEQYEAAEQMYRDYISQSGSFDAHLQLAVFLAQLGRIPEALAICDDQWAKAPGDAVARASLAIVECVGDQPKVQQVVEQHLLDSIRQHPRMAWQKLSLARLRELQNRYPDAIAQYRDVLNIEPHNLWAMNNLAYDLSLVQQDLDQALSLINQGIQITGPLPELLDTRAEVYLARNELPKAIDDLTRLIESAPSPMYYYHLAEAYWKSNDLKNARKLFEQAKSSGFSSDRLGPLEKQRYQKFESALLRESQT